MEIKKGYKQTEIGIIPEDWEVKMLGNVGTFSKGSGISKSETISGNIPAIRYGELYTKHNDYIKNFFSWISFEVASKAKKLKRGDLLFAGSGETKEEIGKCVAYMKSEVAFAGGDIIIFSPQHNNDSVFLGFLLNSPIIQKQKSQKGQGDAIVHISANSLSTIQIPFPPLPEQTAIATVLSDMDKYISSLERLIAKKKAIKQGTMQNLLTGKIRLKGFKGEWVEKKLGEIGIITSSGVDKKIVQGEKLITLLNYLDVYRSTYIRRSLLSHIVTASNEKIKNCSVQKGDVFFTPTSETPDDIAKTAVSLETMNDVVYSYHLIRLRPYVGYNGEFIKFACDTCNFGQQAERFADGSGTRYVISIKKFNEMTILIPPIFAEQTAIATILSDMDTEIEALQAKLQKAKLVKQGAMQELLTGKIRLQQSNTIEFKPKKTGHNDQINEAVVISFLVYKFGTTQYPLSRFRYTKFAYLLHRQAEHEAKGFKKHIAGPYKPENRYKGGEGIAIKNKYISKVKNPQSGKDAFIVSENIEKALSYFCEWYGANIQEWIEQFRYSKNEYLEVLTTVDESICDLQKQNKTITVSSIKEYIASISQWKAKLNKPCFNDLNIHKAINESYKLFEN